MSQILDDGKTVAFGHAKKEVERMFGCIAVDIPLRIARKGIDTIIRAGKLSLEFDSGRLHTITFEHGYKFRNPPTPYSEPWKNFAAIGPMMILGEMHRRDFLTYLSTWEERARSFGAERVESGDLTGMQFAVSIDRDTFTDMIHISMGPSRRACGGGIWCDGWTAFFTMESNRRDEGEEVGRLRSLSAFRDEFNTVARITGGRS